MNRFDYICRSCLHEWRGMSPRNERCPKCGGIGVRVWTRGIYWHPTKGEK